MSWARVALRDIAIIERTGVDPKQLQHKTLYVGLENIEAGGRLLDIRPVSNGDLKSTKFAFGPDHILYGKLRPYLAKIALPDFEGICSTDILPILPGPFVDRSYLCHFLRQPSMVDFAASRSEGANLPRLNPKALSDFEILLPPLDEQKQIAAILDKAHALRVKRRQAIALLDSLTQSIFLEMFGDPVLNPKGWPMTKLGEICTFRGGAQPPKTVFSYEDGPEKIRLIQIRDYKSDRFKTFIPISMAKRFCDETDIMIGRYGPPVFQILKGIRGSYNVALMKAEPKPGVNKSFLFYLLCSHRLQNDVIGQSQRTAGQTGVNLDYLNEYAVPCPSWNAQEEFRACVELVEDKLVQAQQLQTVPIPSSPPSSTAPSPGSSEGPMTIATHKLTLPPPMLQRGFWLYAWRVVTSDGQELVYVGRTGDNSSPNASPAYIRMGQHLGSAETQNALRKHLVNRGIPPESCQSFDLVAHGPIYPEVQKPENFSHEDQLLRKQLMEKHIPLRDIVGAMEKQLAEDLGKAGYTLLNTVKWRHKVDAELWKPIRAAFAEHFPLLKKV